MDLIRLTALLPLGDDTPIGLYAVLVLLAIAALAVTSFLGKKKNSGNSKRRRK